MYWLLILFIFLVFVFSLICLGSNKDSNEDFSTELSWSPNPINVPLTQSQINCCKSRQFRPANIYMNPLCDCSLKMNRLPNQWQSKFFLQNYDEPKKTFYDLFRN